MYKLTLSTVRAELGTLGLTLRVRDGEYRVNFRNGREETAYYTDDLGDARDTGRLMVDPR